MCAMFLLFVCFSLWACTLGVDSKNALEYLHQHSEFSTFANLFHLADLEARLEDASITVLAPTNAAFSSIPTAEMNELKKNKAKLKEFLLYHIVNKTLVTAQIGHNLTVDTLSGSKLTFRDFGNAVMAGSAIITGPDIIVSNGVIQKVSSVLMPPPHLNIMQYIAKDDGELQDFIAAIIVAHMEATLEGGRFTVFAPTDDAFRKYGQRLPADLNGVRQFIRKHIVPGIYMTPELTSRTLLTLAGSSLKVHSDSGGVTVGGAKIVRPNIVLLNGIVHVVDKVID